MTFLYCDSNSLTSLDVSGCTALTYFDCGNNSLTSLDVSTNTALTTLRVASGVTLTGVPSGCWVTTY
jgi:Leucine-rich repeat (LRR) protein